MKYVTRWALIYFSILSLLCAGIRLSADALPTHDPLPDLQKCDGIPCYLDIAPDRTKSIDAYTMLRSKPDIAISAYADNRAIKTVYPFNSISLFQGSSDDSHEPSGFVGEVDLGWLDGTDVNAGSIILKLGQPCGVVNTTSSDLVLVYPGVVVFFSTENRSNESVFTPELTIREVNIFNNHITSCGDVKKADHRAAWHGFGDY